MCTYWKLPARAAGELDTAQVRTGLERVAAHGCGLVNFSGGEPTLRHDLEAIVAHASGLGMWTSIVTNGSVMTRDRLRRLKAAGLDSLLVSVDSADARVHDRGRGMPGSHAKAMECLRWVAEDFAVGHRIGAVMTVIPPVQPETVLGVVDLAERAGLSVLLQPYHERKTGRSNATAAVPEWLARALAARKRTSGCLLNSSAYLAALTSPAAGGGPPPPPKISGGPGRRAASLCGHASSRRRALRLL
jgi:MoaA/NifB/PqqE/SkfB family radical SAM enzyme